MKTADHTNFVSVLSEEKPGMILFYEKSDLAQVKKIKAILEPISQELPLLPLYEYVIDQNEGNEILAEYLDLTKTPVFLFFKNGNFNRYKNKTFTREAILTFIGYTKPYLTEEGRAELERKEAEAKTKKKSPVRKTVKTKVTKTKPKMIKAKPKKST